MVGAAIVMSSLNFTGAGPAIAYVVGIVGEHSIFLMLVLAAFASFLLGMGLPSVPCYLLLVIFVAPGFVKADIYPLVGHLFISWWGLLSAITPPVAVSAMVAASLAQASYWKIGFRAMRLGIVAYIAPFLFVFRPELVLHGEPLIILRSIAIATLAILFLSAALEGYMFFIQKLDSLRRLLFGGAAVLLFIPDIRLNVIGLGVGAVLVFERLTTRQIKRLLARPSS